MLSSPCVTACLRTATALISLLALGACGVRSSSGVMVNNQGEKVIVFKYPPYKGDEQYANEKMTCDGFSQMHSEDLVNAFAGCMISFDNKAQVGNLTLDRALLTPSPSPPSYAQPYQPPPYVPEQQGSITQAPSSGDGNLRPLTDGEKIQIASEAFNTINNIYQKCKDSRHKFLCASGLGIVGMRHTEKMMICRNPYILDIQPVSQIPKIFRDEFLTMLN